eukprot:TRINITY_DN281_c0_g1_i2.p1 TRINITY_DN281_c0_g1~~TRINITY_DN281_c0_g1_i2.p1  ORF type:complete len:400 (-),score=149.06 TRINITY_DN281_c0_g1_i2:101-1300(-)
MRVGVVCVILSVLAVAYAAEFYQVDEPILNKYIVVMNEDVSIVQRDQFLDTLREEMQADAANISEVSGVYDIGSMVGYFATLSPQMLQYTLAHPAIQYVEQDQIMSINYKQSPVTITNAVVTQTGSTWGLARVSRKTATATAYNYVYDSTAGSGVEVWVIDTGVYAENVDFGGRAETVFNAITGEKSTDLNGHGTHCAGTAAGTKYGVAKKATIYGVKVLDANGSGSNAGVIAGVEYATKNHGKRAVANMSLGGSKSTALNTAVANSIASGMPYAVAAGNENQNACNTSPASVATAVTVGAITSTNSRSSFSNWGTCLDVFAPGSDILSDWIGSTTATNTISGTSMASPHVCGVLAQQWSVNPSLSSSQLQSQVLSQTSNSQVTSGGTGSPNKIAFSAY